MCDQLILALDAILEDDPQHHVGLVSRVKAELAHTLLLEEYVFTGVEMPDPLGAHKEPKIANLTVEY